MKENDFSPYGGAENEEYLKSIEEKFAQTEIDRLNSVDLEEAIPPNEMDKALEYAKGLFEAAVTSERRVALVVWGYKGIDKWPKEIADGLRNFVLWVLPKLNEEELRQIDQYNAAEIDRFEKGLHDPEIFEQSDGNPEEKE